MAKRKRSSGKGPRAGLGSAVKPRIYRYGKEKLEGFQSRLKRTNPRTDRPESTSAYFSFAKYGSQAAALAAAERWLRKNERWTEDRKFKPKAPGSGPRASKKGHLRVVKGGGRSGHQKAA